VLTPAGTTIFRIRKSFLRLGGRRGKQLQVRLLQFFPEEGNGPGRPGRAMTPNRAGNPIPWNAAFSNAASHR